ncbi:glycerophosphoryl diester phosphodiesterase [Bacteroidia bacterium]|nr:glycerophosphoryl diester phosphodiesterase [Bacteroidia bacterium]
MKKIQLVLLLVMCYFVVMAQNSQVFVASHRGDWRNYADNSIEGIESCIKMGVDIIEIDLALTKDSVLVLMHDRTVDRTTNGKGLVSDFTLEEIKQLRLKNGLGRVTDFTIPTLVEVMTAVKDKIIVNLDKSDKYFDAVYTILERTGTMGQAIIKSNKPYQELRAKYGDNLDKMIFMPVLTLKPETTIDSISAVLDKKYPYYEICFQEENRELWQQIKAKLSGTSVIWINSLWDSLCGGYSDDKALKDADGTWGYLINDLGAGILQTDRPAMMLDYLQQKKLHD